MGHAERHLKLVKKEQPKAGPIMISSEAQQRWDLIGPTVVQAVESEKKLSIYVKIPTSFVGKPYPEVRDELIKFVGPAFGHMILAVTPGDTPVDVTVNNEYGLPTRHSTVKLMLENGAAQLYRQEAERLATKQANPERGIL